MVQALYELYRSRKEKVLRSWSEVRRILEKEVLPTWRHRRVADIRRRDIRELVEENAQTAPIQGNRVLERISALFTFAVDHDWIEANPAWRIKNRDRNALAIACSRATSYASRRYPEDAAHRLDAVLNAMSLDELVC
jgi:site-specific recombinase XerD